MQTLRVNVILDATQAAEDDRAMTALHCKERKNI